MVRKARKMKNNYTLYLGLANMNKFYLRVINSSAHYYATDYTCTNLYTTDKLVLAKFPNSINSNKAEIY